LRILLTVVAVSSSWLFAPSIASACSCEKNPDWTVQQQVAEGLDWADRVFAGTVTRFDDKDRTFVFRVDGVWKGDDAPEIVINWGYVRDDGLVVINTCDFSFNAGGRYLVWAARTEQGLKASACGLTSRWEQATRVVELLDKLTPRRRPKGE
jgi:hypothetical protein